MNYCATPILYLNMGGEMLYVLQQRLQTQKINHEKTIQVINDVTYAMLNPKQLEMIFNRGPLMNLAWLRTSLERVALSSIIKLDENSMNKLFDLVTMMVKCQLTTSTGPREIILLTMNHLDAIRDMIVDKKFRDCVESTHRYMVETYGGMTYKEIWQIRNDCLKVIENQCVRVSILLRLGMQNEDTSFNRLVQRYDEKYQERYKILENFKLLDYCENESLVGSLTLYGHRITLLGKNIYASTFGLVSNNRSSQSSHQHESDGNKAIRREIETLAKQLGKQTTTTGRPFSLRLIGYYSDKTTMNNCITTNRVDDNENKILDNNKKDREGNFLNKTTQDINNYKTNLLKSIGSDFSDDDNDEQTNKTRDLDIMNMLDVAM